MKDEIYPYGRYSISFIDLEVDARTKKVFDIGAVKCNGSVFHRSSITEFTHFLLGTHYMCGHNILNHDLKYIKETVSALGLRQENFIDTLYLSPLLFPANPYHSLLKDDKLQSDEMNNPLNDSIKAKNLFDDEIAAFKNLDANFKEILHGLLYDQKEFSAFFRFIHFESSGDNAETLVRRRFDSEICEYSDVGKFVRENPIELAYCLSLTDSFIKHKQIHSITPPWVLKNYPGVEKILVRLRSTPCIPGCNYCNQKLDAHKGLQQFFGFDSFRSYGSEPLQENAVKASIANKSILAVFPTGGGKSITFQVPALMSGANSKGLTVVISPLQSLMKDQVDNLEKIGITDAVTINGLLDPIEKAKSFERVENGSASMLYISPESLRSKSIERLILGRKIARFVIDEAHCFSSWGQDFRVDYLYIGDFIRSIQQKKNLEDGIPVSCFTATAKQKVIEDIRDYFREKLSLELELFTSKASRTNLHYKVFEKGDEEDKYQMMRNLVEDKNCPTIIYVSRTKKAFMLAERLCKDGFSAKPYHGKMEANEKTANQNAFIAGEVPIMVATSAFGMGVDKKDVGMVIHYEISDSLENYVQEAGRAGRDENIEAECFVLFNEEDLSKHFILLNQTRLSIKEIQQVWKAIKGITKFRSTVSNSALEIARKAGWDDSVVQIETRVTTAIAALEDAGYLKRGQNMPRVFANSILSKNAQEAIDKINSSEKFAENQKEKGIRIIKKLFSSKSRTPSTDEAASSRIDYIGDHLGIVKEEVINIVNLLREENILADAKDLTAFVKKGENKNRSLNVVESFNKIERFLLQKFEEQEKTFHIKSLNEDAEADGCCDVSPARIKTIINFWAIKNWIRRENLKYSKNHFAALSLHSISSLTEKLEKRHELSKFIIEFLHARSLSTIAEGETNQDEILVEFSVHELKAAYDVSQNLFKFDVNINDIEDALFYLSRIEAIKIEGGFLVSYNRLTIERLEQNNSKNYTKDDYRKLNQFYENKVQQIHIVGEYARKMIDDYKDALQFVEDYFQLNFSSFLRRYFPGSKVDQLKLRMTPGKFRQLFGELSPTQLKIINENESKYIAVAAGPGSGKTRVLVHKLASLLLMEDVKHEQLLMVTFSRAAATEFKKRLLQLIGNAAHYVEIKTFHSYCFDLLGKVGSLDKSDSIIRTAIEKIKSGEVEANRITKTVLVIDEAQDMDQDEYNLINALMEQNDDMRIIAVGDDDQNIYAFRGASSKYLEQFIDVNGAVKHELIENYRSKSNLVSFSNQFVSQISKRLKETPIIARQSENGKIKLVRYQNGSLITPVVQSICSAGLTGTTCVLTKKNDDALLIAGMLLKKGVQARLIQDNEGFSLYNLLEVRRFLSKLQMRNDVFIINDELWETAKRELQEEFRRSDKLGICNNIIQEFEETYPTRKYKSDFEVFIRESKLEDFFSENGETIFVSTIHKSKGKEFDNVFLMLDNFNASGDDAKRQLYVAMTRAKKKLEIHLNSGFLDTIYAEDIESINDDEVHLPPNEIALHLGHKDVVLDYFVDKQRAISQLQSGDSLLAVGHECLDAKSQPILRFSKSFVQKMEEMKSRGFKLKSVKANFVVHWLKEGAEDEVLVVLAEVWFEKGVS